MNKINQVKSKRAWGFKLLSFEMIHIKIVKGIYAYICCIAAYNSALPIQNGTCEWFRNAIVSVDKSFSNHSTLRFKTHASVRGKPECEDYVPLSVRANRLSVCCKSGGDEALLGRGDLNTQVLLSYFWLLILRSSCQLLGATECLASRHLKSPQSKTHLSGNSFYQSPCGEAYTISTHTHKNIKCTEDHKSVNANLLLLSHTAWIFLHDAVRQ